MSFAISRLVSLSQQQCRTWSRLNLGYSSIYLSKRYVQEFPVTRLDNSTHKDHVFILPEVLKDLNNELIRLPHVPISEINFNKINAELAFKGLSLAINNFENFLVDIENEPDFSNKTPEELFKSIDQYLMPMDSAYDTLIVLLCVNEKAFSYKEIANILQRYNDSRNKRFIGVIEKTLNSFDLNSDKIDQPDKKMITFYKTQMICPVDRRPLGTSTLFALRRNLKQDTTRFIQSVVLADSIMSHTVDDPDILAAVADEYNDCQELHHKERTPLKVTAATYDKFMKVCPDRFVRRMLWETYNKRCSPKAHPKLNTSLVQTNIQVTRRKVAELSGYRSHLDFKLRNTMAKSKENVLASLKAIHQENKQKLEDLLQELNDYAYDNGFEDPSGAGIQEYDVDYWSHRYSHDVLIGMSQQQLANYFPLESVIDGIKCFLTNYLEIEISTNKRMTGNFWSPHVQVFELKRNGQPLGNIIFDPFQNGTRRTSCTLSGRIRSRFPYDDISPTRLISVPYNIEPSTQAAHLRVNDVPNLFHCFISVLQTLLYDYKYYELNSMGALEYDTLDLLPYFSRAHLLSNHKIIQSMSNRGNSRPIDSELASRIMKSFHYFRPLHTWRDLYTAHLDLEIHSVMTSIKSLVEDAYKIYSPYGRFQDNYDYCTMSDIFVGPYDGIKYADLWARQLAMKCISELQDSNGLLDDDKLKESYSRLIDVLFDPNNLQTQSKLVKFFKPGTELNQSGLGVL